MAGAAGPIHEERLVGLERLLIAQPLDGVVGQVLAEVILLAGRVIGMDHGRVAHEVRLVLRRLAGEEAVEVFEAVAGRPILERAGGGGLIGGRVVPLAEGRRGVAVVLQDLGDRRARLRDDARIAVPVVGQLRDLPVADAMMVAPREQGRAGRGAHGGGVKPVEGNPAPVDAVECRCVDLSTIGGRQGGAGIVSQDDDDVGRVGWQTPRCGARTVDRFLHGPVGGASRRLGWEG